MVDFESREDILDVGIENGSKSNPFHQIRTNRKIAAQTYWEASLILSRHREMLSGILLCRFFWNDTDRITFLYKLADRTHVRTLS
jgi:hypothetical protein